MNEEQQRIKIAEACGWVEVRAEVDWLPGDLTGIYTWPHPTDPEKTKYYISRKPVPDYFNDLNAIHNAIRILTDAQRIAFKVHLTKVWMRDYNCRCGYFPNHDDSCNATAAQRAEAFLRTLDSWIE
jgi:hypothetical protein